MKILSLLTGIVLCLVIGATSFASDSGEVNLRASIGFNGHYKEGKWVPVFIEVENQGASVDGEFIITTPAGISFKDTPLPYTLPAHIDANSTSHFTMYICSPGSFYRFFTRVKFLSHGEVIASTGESFSAETMQKEMQKTELTSIWKALALLVSKKKKIELPDEVKLHDGSILELQQVNISTEDLPDKWIGLDSADLVIISTEQIPRLSKCQEEALISWVASGRGIIIFGVINQPLSETELLKRLLPVTIGVSENLSELKSLSELSQESLQCEEGFVVTRCRLKNRSLAIYQEGDLPLISQKGYGLGTVIYLAFDFQSPSFLAWKGSDNLWKKLMPGFEEQLVRKANIHQTYHGEWQFDTRVMRLAGKIPEMRIPPLGMILVFLMIYILALVPGTYLILKKSNRSELSWLVIPILVVVFSIIFYLYGGNFKGEETAVSEISITSSTPDHPESFVTSYLGIFSPAKDTYDLSFQDRDIFIKEIASKPYQEPFSRRFEHHILQGREKKIAGLSINKWAMKGFRLDEIVPKPPVELSIILKNGSWELMVTNNTSYSLVDCQLNYQGKERFIGTIESGGKIKRESQDMQTVIKYSGPNAHRKKELIDILKAAESLCEISGCGCCGWDFESPYRKVLVESPRPLLLAWVEVPIFKIGMDKTKSRREGLNLLLFHLFPEESGR